MKPMVPRVPYDVPPGVHADAVADPELAQIVARQRAAGGCGQIYIQLLSGPYMCTAGLGHAGKHSASDLAEWDDSGGEE